MRSMPAWLHRLLVIVACLAASLAIEVFAFNSQWWIYNKGYEEFEPSLVQEWSSDDAIPADADEAGYPRGAGDDANDADETAGSDEAVSDDAEPEAPVIPPGIPASAQAYDKELFSLDNKEISSVAFDVSAIGTPAQNQKMRVTVSIADSGHANETYDVTSLDLPVRSSSFVLPVSAYGYAKQLSISVCTELPLESLRLDSVSVNAHVPANKSPVRLSLVLCALLALYAFRPRGAVWRIRYADAPLRSIVCAIVTIACACSMFAWGYDEPDETWRDCPHSLDEYASLARTLPQGQLALSREVPEWLLAMDDLSDGDARLSGDDNVFDYTSRFREYDEACLEQGSLVASYKHDSAYHDGRYYVYFGVGPVLLAYLPYHIVTGGDLPNTTACFAFLMVFAIFSYLLLDLLVRRRFESASCGTVAICYVAWLASSYLVYTMSVPTLYCAPISSALAVLSVGAYLLLLSATMRLPLPIRCIFAFLGALFLSLTLACRPQFAVGAMFCAGAYALWVARSDCPLRQRFAVIACGVIAAGIVASSLGAYNFLRFGSPFDFGASYNLTGNDMTLRGFHFDRAVEGTIWYFLGIPHLSSMFPYVSIYGVPASFPGWITSESFTFGLLVGCPFLFLVARFASSKELGAPTRALLCALAASSVAVAAFDNEGAGLIVRYIEDFGYLMGAAFVIGWLSYDRACLDPGSEFLSIMRYRTNGLVVILVALSLVACVLMWLANTFEFGFPLDGTIDAISVHGIFAPWDGRWLALT